MTIFRITSIVFIGISLHAKPQLPKTLILDHSFFVANSQGEEDFRIYRDNKAAIIVKTGESFGIWAKAVSAHKKIKLTAVLIVPNSPENFGCKTCKAGELVILRDRKTIVVSTFMDINKLIGFNWAIDKNDPRGEYQMSLTADGLDVGTYTFEVK